MIWRCGVDVQCWIPVAGIPSFLILTFACRDEEEGEKLFETGEVFRRVLRRRWTSDSTGNTVNALRIM
jgi:hypothetical protein